MSDKIAEELEQHRVRFERVKELRNIGFNVVPLGIRSKITPYKWKAYQTERVTEDVLDCWYSSENERNWALLQGAISGTVTMEADDDKALRLMAERCPETPVKQKSRKGEHWLYRYPGGHVGNRLKIRVGGDKYNLDIKGDGGFIVAPLSVHPSGHIYHEITPWTKELIQAAPVFDPTWLGLDQRDRPEWDADHDDAVDAPDMPPMRIRLDAAQKWLKRQHGAKQGQGDGADGYCLALAMKLLWGFALSKDSAKDLLWDWGQRHDNQDGHGAWYPWAHQQIGHKIDDAARKLYRGRPGDLLPKNWHHGLEAEIDKIIKPAGTATTITNETQVKKADDFAAKMDDWTKQAQKPITFETWDQTCTIAANQKEDWLIPHWAECGCLHILTGLPFSGKSSIVAEIVACMATGIPFCDMQVQQVPLLVLDLENKERIIVKRIKNALGGDHGDLKRLWHRVNPVHIARPLTNSYLRTCIEAVKQTTGTDKGLVVIDTMRSAFAGSGKKENDNDDMGAILYPLQALAQQTNWAVLVLHHNNKSSGHFSGAGVIAGAADYLWNWTSDKAKLTGELAMDGGRDDHQYPLQFRYDMDTQRNIFLGKSTERLATEAKEKHDQTLAPWLSLLPSDPDKAVDKDYLRTEALKAKLLDPLVQVKAHIKTVERRMQEGINSQYVGFVGGGGRSDRYRFHLTQTGMSAVVRVQAQHA
jgi:RecA-family ATPase